MIYKIYQLFPVGLFTTINVFLDLFSLVDTTNISFLGLFSLAVTPNISFLILISLAVTTNILFILMMDYFFSSRDGTAGSRDRRYGGRSSCPWAGNQLLCRRSPRPYARSFSGLDPQGTAPGV